MTSAIVSYAPSSLAELEDWAKRYAAAFNGPYRNKPQDVVLAVMWGAELGMQPMQSLRAIAVINGKPSVYGDDLVGLAERYGKIVSRREGFLGKPFDDDFRAWCECTTPNGDVFRQEFSVADAILAKLWGKPGPWQTNPKRMLQFRARNFCVRDAAPDLGLGPSAEEMREVEDDESRATKARDVTPPRQHQDGTPFTPHEEVDAALNEIGETLGDPPTAEELAANRSARATERAEAQARADAANERDLAEERRRDPLGINGSDRPTAIAILSNGFASARTAADAEALYETYRPRIDKLVKGSRDMLAAIIAKRIEDEAEQRRRGESEEFGDILADQGELIGPDE